MNDADVTQVLTRVHGDPDALHCEEEQLFKVLRTKHEPVFRDVDERRKYEEDVYTGRIKLFANFHVFRNVNLLERLFEYPRNPDRRKSKKVRKFRY
jgi:hypothetical protein